MTNTLDQLVKQVETWSVDKNLHNGNPDRQALKFYEEAGEVASALSRGQMDGDRRYGRYINYIGTTT